jgi:hypothetical protein
VCPFPSPHFKGQQLKTRPEYRIGGLHEASAQGIEATSANLLEKECLGVRQNPKAMLPRPRRGARGRQVKRASAESRETLRCLGARRSCGGSPQVNFARAHPNTRAHLNAPLSHLSLSTAMRRADSEEDASMAEVRPLRARVGSGFHVHLVNSSDSNQ